MLSAARALLPHESTMQVSMAFRYVVSEHWQSMSVLSIQSIKGSDDMYGEKWEGKGDALGAALGREQTVFHTGVEDGGGARQTRGREDRGLRQCGGDEESEDGEGLREHFREE